MSPGRNDQGQLGLGDTDEAKTPVLVESMAAHKYGQAEFACNCHVSTA
jgi:hypothetical protein